MKTGFLRYIFENWHLKLFSFFFATVLFIMVRNDKDTSGSLTVQVKYINKPKYKMLLNEPIDSVKLEVKGPWMKIRKLNDLKPRKLIVNLSKVKNDRFDLDPSLFKLPKGVRIISITPNSLPVRLESKLSRTVPITIKVDGNRFFYVTDVVLKPSKIKLTGPKSQILSFPSIPLPPVKIKTGGVKEIKIKFPDLPPNVIKNPDVEFVKVKIFSEKNMGVKTFSHIPVRITGKNADVKLVPQQVEVTVEGSKKNLYSLSPSRIIPYVRIDEEIKKSKSFKVKLQKIPSGLRYSINPRKITVFPEKNDSKKKSGDQ